MCVCVGGGHPYGSLEGWDGGWGCRRALLSSIEFPLTKSICETINDCFDECMDKLRGERIWQHVNLSDLGDSVIKHTCVAPTPNKRRMGNRVRVGEIHKGTATYSTVIKYEKNRKTATQSVRSKRAFVLGRSAWTAECSHDPIRRFWSTSPPR